MREQMDWQSARAVSIAQNSDGQSLKSWLDVCRKSCNSTVEEIPLKNMRKWEFCRRGGLLSLCHETGQFFSIEGRRIETNFGPKRSWDQAVILQPEQGLLGIIARIHQGVLELLVQAKMEPGCINAIQISPSIQATRSNYSQVHKGKIPAYLNYFMDTDNIGHWIIRSPQTEQTTRFLAKKNINAFCIAQDASQIPLSENHRWCTLRDIRELYLENNGINMNLRSIMAALPPLIAKKYPAGKDILPKNPQLGNLISRLYSSLSTDAIATNRSPIYETMLWWNGMQKKYTVAHTPRSLDSLEGWKLTDSSIESDYFSVMGVRVQANREVSEWDQPLIKQDMNGLSVLVGATLHGIPHFLFQAKCDFGGEPSVHLAPTLSCSVPQLRRNTEQAPPFLEFILSLPPDAFVFDRILSEEGGRFWRCENDYKILWDEGFPTNDIPENYRWIPYAMIFEFIRHGCVNIEARSILGVLQ